MARPRRTLASIWSARVGERPTIISETHDQPTSLSPTNERPALTSGGRARALVLTGIRVVAKTIVVIVLSAGLLTGLVAGGLFMSPLVSAAAEGVDSPPRRPPIIPPSVPLGAREELAVWSYVEKINQAWGRDWPLVIQWFEELDARYPGNPMVLDKLYVSYLEDGRNLQLQGDIQGARQRYEQAASHHPDRGVAQELLAELDKEHPAGR
jgi:hypothetical protein